MKLTLGFSPCPNDCFIFDALIHEKIDTKGFSFDVRLEDVETLNSLAKDNVLDISKLSVHAYTHLSESYVMLRSGGALGYGCGPLIISRKNIVNPAAEIRSIAIPGKMTTANFLLSIAFPTITDKHEMVFSNIEQAVLEGKADAGVIIHENRFTYAEKGLHKVIDLGEFWNDFAHAPIPLGIIAARRNLEPEILYKLSNIIAESVRYAFAHPESSLPFVRQRAQAMSDQVMRQHIELYVNQFSVDMGPEGESAIAKFIGEGRRLNFIPPVKTPWVIASSPAS